MLLNCNVKVRPGYVSPAFVGGSGTGVAWVRPICSHRKTVVIMLCCVDETAMTSKFITNSSQLVSVHISRGSDRLQGVGGGVG